MLSVLKNGQQKCQMAILFWLDAGLLLSSVSWTFKLIPNFSNSSHLIFPNSSGRYLIFILTRIARHFQHQQLCFTLHPCLTQFPSPIPPLFHLFLQLDSLKHGVLTAAASVPKATTKQKTTLVNWHYWQELWSLKTNIWDFREGFFFMQQFFQFLPDFKWVGYQNLSFVSGCCCILCT